MIHVIVEVEKNLKNVIEQNNKISREKSQKDFSDVFIYMVNLNLTEMLGFYKNI